MWTSALRRATNDSNAAIGCTGRHEPDSNWKYSHSRSFSAASTSRRIASHSDHSPQPVRAGNGTKRRLGRGRHADGCLPKS
jgi:hypothetical protein